MMHRRDSRELFDQVPHEARHGELVDDVINLEHEEHCHSVENELVVVWRLGDVAGPSMAV
jgi:hypothetical protein